MRNVPGSTGRAEVLDRLFVDYQGPAFAVRLWDGWSWNSTAKQAPRCTVVVRSEEALRRMVLRPGEITLGESFLAGEIDVEGDIFSVFAMAEHLFNRPRSGSQRVREAAAQAAASVAQWWRKGQRHTKERDREAIAYHYDQPVEFYRAWLGESMVYSCAYFRQAGEALAAAQANKMELILRKLRLEPGERFLDVGCGWGSLALHAAAKHGAQATGITISREQAAVAEARIESARMKESCGVRLMDYREAPARLGEFDKIASVGMFEHVGLKRLPEYFRGVYAMLRPGGLFLNHGIARARARCDPRLFPRELHPVLSRIPGLRGIRRSSFVDAHVFPDGELVTLSEATQAAEAAGFEVRDVENLREHYALTLRQWTEGLRKNAAAVLKVAPERTCRTWLLYMAGSAAAFGRGDIAVYQMLLSKPDHGRSGLPLTREDLILPEDAAATSQAAWARG